MLNGSYVLRDLTTCDTSEPALQACKVLNLQGLKAGQASSQRHAAVLSVLGGGLPRSVSACLAGLWLQGRKRFRPLLSIPAAGSVLYSWFNTTLQCVAGQSSPVSGASMAAPAGIQAPPQTAPTSIAGTPDQLLALLGNPNVTRIVLGGAPGAVLGGHGDAGGRGAKCMTSGLHTVSAPAGMSLSQAGKGPLGRVGMQAPTGISHGSMQATVPGWLILPPLQCTCPLGRPPWQVSPFQSYFTTEAWILHRWMAKLKVLVVVGSIAHLAAALVSWPCCCCFGGPS